MSVQALMGHLSADTARWSPQLDPFNATMSARIGTLSDDLVKQVPLADSPRMAKAVRANARAFAELRAAMRGKSRANVTRAVGGTRVAYRELKQVCSFQ